jgi:serine/threonine protein phosphatase PrpC
MAEDFDHSGSAASGAAQRPGAIACPACGAATAEGDRFCESCGHELAAPVPAAAPAPVPAAAPGSDGRWVSSAEAPVACPNCGGTGFDAEGYCDTCGQRRPSGHDHRELDLGVVAGVTDRGKRHSRNEDAMGLGVGNGALVAVVCDGVSTSHRPDTASHAAVKAATPALLAELAGGPQAALQAATRAAQAAAALAAGAEPGLNPPSCTFVSAVVEPDAVTVGWVGDSRAYWLPEHGEPACLTTDDSLAGQLAAAGVPVAEALEAGPATALVRWLGADALDTSPHLVTFNPPGPGRVLVCSDGLFRYRPAAADLAAVTPAKPPLDTARELVSFALDEGGHDNVTVIVLSYPPLPAGGSAS